MKNYEEMAREVLHARDAFLMKQQRRKAIARRYVPIVSSFCFAVLIGVGVWKDRQNLPEIASVSDTEMTESTSTTKETQETSITESAQLAESETMTEIPEILPASETQQTDFIITVSEETRTETIIPETVTETLIYETITEESINTEPPVMQSVTEASETREIQIFTGTNPLETSTAEITQPSASETSEIQIFTETNPPETSVTSITQPPVSGTRELQIFTGTKPPETSTAEITQPSASETQTVMTADELTGECTQEPPRTDENTAETTGKPVPEDTQETIPPETTETEEIIRESTTETFPITDGGEDSHPLSVRYTTITRMMKETTNSPAEAYTITEYQIPADWLEEYLETVTATGYDSYTQVYTCEADMYLIQSIWAGDAVAVRFPGTNEYYLCISTDLDSAQKNQLLEELGFIP